MSSYLALTFTTKSNVNYKLMYEKHTVLIKPVLSIYYTSGLHRMHACEHASGVADGLIKHKDILVGFLVATEEERQTTSFKQRNTHCLYYKA